MKWWFVLLLGMGALTPQQVPLLGRVVPGRSLIGPALPSQGDFGNASCYYNIQVNGSNSTYDQGLAVRYVGGQQRFLTIGLNGSNQLFLSEFTLSGHTCGDTITTTTNTWATPWGSPLSSAGVCASVWYDTVGARLWTTSTINCLAYGSTNPQQVTIYTRTLNSNGTVSNVHGPVGLQGIVDRRVFGGCAYTPTAVQTLYSVPAYLCGWGNYTSVFAQNGLASLGGTAYFLPDPAGFGNTTEIPTGTFKTGMDHSSGSTSTDWYAGGLPPPYDRGIRATTDVQSYFDPAGVADPRSNPTCSGQSITVNTSGTTVTDPNTNNCFQQWWAPAWWAPTGQSPAYTVLINSVPYTVSGAAMASCAFPPNYCNVLTLTTSAGTQTGVTLVAPSNHPSPFFTPVNGTWAGHNTAPDGFVRWTWGDGYWGSGFVIDTATRRGLLAIYTGCSGNCYYNSSAGVDDAFEYEMHVYDFTQLGQVVQGARSAWRVQPTVMWALTLPNNVATPTSGSVGTVTGAVFDPTTKHVYPYLTTGHNATTNRLYDIACTTC